MATLEAIGPSPYMYCRRVWLPLGDMDQSPYMNCRRVWLPLGAMDPSPLICDVEAYGYPLGPWIHPLICDVEEYGYH